MEVLLLIGALAGLCMLVAVAVTDLTLRTAEELGDLETAEPVSN